MVGLFGLMAYTVQQRTRELGVRRALGATTGNIVRLVAGEVTRVTLAVVALGLVSAALLGRGVSTMQFGVSPLDLTTFALVLVAVVVTTALAAVVPARRALRVEPVSLLRE